MKDLCIREVYTKDGVEKVSWNKIGVLIEGREGKQYVKLYHIPGQLISVFDQKKKRNKYKRRYVSMGRIILSIMLLIVAIPALPFLTLGIWLVNKLDDMDENR